MRSAPVDKQLDARRDLHLPQLLGGVSQDSIALAWRAIDAPALAIHP